jgi:hypothetical protein
VLTLLGDLKYYLAIPVFTALIRLLHDSLRGYSLQALHAQYYARTAHMKGTFTIPRAQRCGFYIYLYVGTNDQDGHRDVQGLHRTAHKPTGSLIGSGYGF